MTSQAFKVFVADDEPTVLRNLAVILRMAGYLVETFDCPRALLSRLSPSDRGCALIDLRMPGLNGLELQGALVDRGVRMPLVFMSGHADVPAAVTAMKRGAIDFLSKPFEPEALIAAVERALANESATASQRETIVGLRQRWAELTPREQQVSRFVARGLLHKQIAAELGTTEGTVQTQRACAMKRLGVGSVAELVRFLVLLDQS